MSETALDFADTYVVVPAFNEQAVITTVIDDVARFVPKTQILVVDDASTDQTADVADAHGATVVRHLVNRGQGAALATGIAAARGAGAKVIVTFDADAQHSADDLSTMVQPVFAGECDVVLGSRFIGDVEQDMPTDRRVMLRLAIWFTRIFSNLRITDTHNGFRVFSAAAAEQIQIRQDRMAHASEILDEIRRLRLNYVEKPVRIVYSQYSLAKGQKSTDALRLALRILYYKVTG